MSLNKENTTMERSIDKTYNNNQSLSSSSLSKTMILLKNQSATKARKYVESKFKKPADLQDIAGIRIQLEKQLQQTDSQLNTVVQAKLEAFKRSVDLMDEATNKLSQFSKIMTSVDYKISQANTEISQFPYLKRVNNIKENLDKVINQIEYFADVPEKDVELRKMLLEEPDKLREVFLESVKLDSLRSALVKEIGDGKEDAELRVSVEEYLKTVPVLAAAIVSRILTFMQGSANHDVDAGLDDLIVSQGEGAFRDFIDHALLSPADLVAHFEVVELHQEYFDRRVRADSSLIAVSTSATPVALPVHRNTVRNRPVSTLRPGLENYNIRPRVLLAMTEALSKRVKDCFRTHNEAALENKTSQVTALLDAGSDLIKLLVDLINDVDPCVPPSYGLVPLYFGVLMAELTPRIDDVCARVQQVKLAEIIDLMDWLRYFVEQMDRFRLRDQPCCDQFLVLCEEVLLMEYLERLKTQLADLFQNIQSQASQMVVESAEGRQLTSAPEDMFNVAYVQLGVARDGLPADFLKHALVAVFQVLGEVQRSSHDTLAKRWRLFNPVQLCAVINDNRRMQEKCIELASSMIAHVPTQEDREMLANQARTVADEYLAIATKTTDLLAKWIIVTELDEPVLVRLFSQEWEVGDPSCSGLADIVVATCADYLGDIQRWLNKVFVSRFLQQLAASACSHYCMALRRRWVQISILAEKDRSLLNRGVFGNGFRVAELIMGDRQVMLKFFGRCERDLEEKPDAQRDGGAFEYDLADRNGSSNQSGIFTTELMPMQCLAKIIVASHLSGIQNEVQSIFERWGIDGLRLVHCAVLCNTTISSTVKTERQDMLDAVVSLFAKAANRYSREYADEFKYIRDDDSAQDLSSLLAQYSQSYSGPSSNNGTKKSKAYW